MTRDFVIVPGALFVVFRSWPSKKSEGVDAASSYYRKVSNSELVFKVEVILLKYFDCVFHGMEMRAASD